MTKSTEKSKLKGKKVNVVGRRGVSKATKGSFLPLEHENSIEEKESESNSSKPVLEEEASRSSGAKGASRRKARQYIVVPIEPPPPPMSARSERYIDRYCMKKSLEIYGEWKVDKDARK